MKENIDLTEGRDFRDKPKDHTLSFQRQLKKSQIFPRWTEETSIFRPDSILRELGIRTFSGQDDFPPKDRCERCGKKIGPWYEGLCKRCDRDLQENRIYNKKGLPREEPIISTPEILWR